MPEDNSTTTTRNVGMRPISTARVPVMSSAGTSLFLVYLALGFFVHGGIAGVFGSIIFLALLGLLMFFLLFNLLGVFLQGYVGWVYLLPLFSDFVRYPITWLEIGPFVGVLIISTVYSLLHLSRVFKK
ncbi:MAG: hypothetical protein HY376_02155 [Candidatus Blackburnbacteria bacterium]|nr:hypothetical protein [Candidatus Blackburnbacteria bacterium]